MNLAIHRHSYRVLLKTYGPGPLVLSRLHPLLPSLTAPVSRDNARLDQSIEIIGPDHILGQIQPDAGYTLHRFHFHRLMDWITHHVELGQMAWPAMMDYYRIHDMQDEDYDTATAYRMWHRSQRHKNLKNIAHFSPFTVLKNVQPHTKSLNVIFEITESIISHAPDAFLDRTGQPDPSMIRKAIMYTMSHHCGWSQADIAEVFSMDRSGVSRHVSTISPYLSSALS